MPTATASSNDASSNDANCASLESLWRAVLGQRADAVAVRDFASGTVHTFAQVEALAAACEAQLRQAGIGAGQTVFLALPNGAHWLAAYLALSRTAATIAPLEATADAKAALAKCAALTQTLPAAACIHADGLTLLSAQSAAHNAEKENVAGNDCCAHVHTQTHTQTHADARTHTHLIKFTSGSTGVPQALPFTLANMLADGHCIIAAMELRAHSVNYALIPFGHSYGLGNLVMPFFIQGTPIVCGSSLLPRVIAQEINESRATVFPTVPTLVRVLAAAQLPPHAFAPLEKIVTAGSALRADVARAFYAQYGKKIHNFYGSSETGAICFDRDGSAALGGEYVGWPMPGVSLRIDEGGGIRVSGAAVCAALQQDGGNDCGVLLPDCGQLLANGALALHGRVGNDVKIGARRLSLSQWETRVRALPGVEDALACTAQRRSGETMLCAAIQTALEDAALRQLLRGSLENWEMPKRLLLLPTFPVNARGKPHYAQLREQLQAGGTQH